jgi:hypothetical protein
MKHLVQILKVNPLRSGIGKKSGNPYSMQDCECAVLNEMGVVEHVGGFMLPKDMTGEKAPVPGTYEATFALGVDQERKIVARVIALVSYQRTAASGLPIPSQTVAGVKS